MPWIIGGGALIGGYLGYKGAKDASNTSAGAANSAARMQYEQYMQGRQDLSPYRQVAVGQEIYGNKKAFYSDVYKYDGRKENLKAAYTSGQMPQGDYQRAINELGDRPTEASWSAENGAIDEVTGYTGGALNQLADYGRTAIDPNSYIPANNIPEYQRSTIGLDPNNIPKYDVNGQVSDFGRGTRQNQYDGQNFDITKDPSYQFRLDEQNRQINRNMAGMGGLVSGNRLEEIMKRSGQMASQEYAAADARNVRDYRIGAGVNRENYGRDVGEFGLLRASEDARFGRDLTAYNANRQNEDKQYNRNYAQNIDQYGRDLTAYNANTARENELYNRGVDAYGRAYGAEGDYLNRLTTLSNIGQTSTTNTGQFGANSAARQGANIVAAGNAQAAGAIGKASAWQQGLGDLTSLGTQYYMNQQNPNTYNYNGAGGGIPYDQFVTDRNYNPWR